MICYCIMVHNRWETLQHLLASMQRLWGADFRATVLDLGSTDVRLVDKCRRYPWLQVVPHKLHRGRVNRSAGRNAAAAAAAAKPGDVLFFLDADMIVPANFNYIIRASVSPGECFFPICYSLHQGRPRIARGNVDQWQKEAHKRANGWWRHEGWGNCGFLLEDYERLGTWDENIGRTYGGEDNNVCSRARKLFKMTRFNCHGFFHQWHPPNR